jgi:glyoxylase-like metal-dependent hydrolase (beta-lactamase superfamily II)
VGNLDMAPGATLHVPARELEFWSSPLARHPIFAHHVDDWTLDRLRLLEDAGRVRRFAGRGDVVSGVEAIPVGGHSPGQQIFVVATAQRPVILASDAVHLYEELAERRPFAVVADLVAMYEAYEVVTDLAAEMDGVVVPGHDPDVVARFAEIPGCAGLASRLA